MKAEELYNATLPLSLQNMWHNTAYFGISSLILCSSFKNISHREFSNEDRLLVQLCYQQYHHVEKLEVYTWCINDTSFSTPMPSPPPLKGRRTTKTMLGGLVPSSVCHRSQHLHHRITKRLRLEGTFEDDCLSFGSKQDILVKIEENSFSKSLGQTFRIAHILLKKSACIC